MDKHILEESVKSGLSTYKIAKLLNSSQTNVRYWLNKYGLKTKPLKRTCITIVNGIKMKHCPKCNNDLSLDNFYGTDKRPIHSYCKKCTNDLTISTQQNLKKRAVKYKGGKCCKCGYDKCIAALEFHHIDPSIKDFNISKRYSKMEKVNKELDKCILVCANCHREIHNPQ